mgnify:CR=1 FL=1
MEEKKTETYEQSIRRRPILRVMAWVGLVVIFALIVLDRDRRDGQQIFYAESCADDHSADTHLCGALAGKGSAKSQKESVLKNKGWFAILDWMKK